MDAKIRKIFVISKRNTAITTFFNIVMAVVQRSLAVLRSLMNLKKVVLFFHKTTFLCFPGKIKRLFMKIEPF